jgi:hypothetical protein
MGGVIGTVLRRSRCAPRLTEEKPLANRICTGDRDSERLESEAENIFRQAALRHDLKTEPRVLNSNLCEETPLG